jgi:hypothetical protein
VVTERGVVVFDAGGSPMMGQAIAAKVRSVTDKPITQIFAHPRARDFVVATQRRWLTRRVRMVPSIRRVVTEALNR